MKSAMAQNQLRHFQISGPDVGNFEMYKDTQTLLSASQDYKRKLSSESKV